MESDKTYIEILVYSLQTKVKVLEDIIALTKEQEILLSQGSSMDIDEFNRTTEAKGPLIDKINELNNGFETLYERIKDEFQKNKMKYAVEITQLQELIKVVTDKSVQIQATEKRNHVKLKVYLEAKKTEIKEFKKSSKTVSSYYKNMANLHQGQSYFLDKRK